MSSPLSTSPSLSDDTLPFTDTQLTHLSHFITFITKNPDVIHNEKLAFFKQYLLDMGCSEISPYKLNLNVGRDGKVADAPQEPKRKPVIQELTTFEHEEEKIVADLDQGDAKLPAHYLSNMGDTFVPTKESTKEAVDVKTRAVEAFRNEEYEKSALLFGRAIYLSGGKFHALFMKRAECLYHMKKYLSARRDATKSIDLHEENHRAYKIRGKANAALKQWVEAVHDFEKAQKYDAKDEELKPLLEEARKNSPADSSKSIYFSKKPKSTSSITDTSVQKSTTTPKAVTQKKQKTTTTKPAEHTQYLLNTELSEKDKMDAVNSIQKDKALLESFTNPSVSKMLDDISRDPTKFFEYQKTNPEIADLFGSFMGLMAKKK